MRYSRLQWVTIGYDGFKVGNNGLQWITVDYNGYCRLQ